MSVATFVAFDVHGNENGNSVHKHEDGDEREEVLTKMLQAALQVLHVGEVGGTMHSSQAGFLRSQSSKDALRAAGEVVFKALGEEHAWSKQRISELEMLNVSLQKQVRDKSEQCNIAFAQAAEAASDVDTLYLDLGRQRRLAAEAAAKVSAEHRETEERHHKEVHALQSRLRSLELEIRSKGASVGSALKVAAMEQEETIARHAKEIQKLKDDIAIGDRNVQQLSSTLADSEARCAELNALNSKLLEQQDACRLCRDRRIRMGNLPAIDTGRAKAEADQPSFNVSGIAVPSNQVTGRQLMVERPKSADMLSSRNRRTNAVNANATSKLARPSTATNCHAQSETLELQQPKQPSVDTWNSWTVGAKIKDDTPQRCTSACSTSASTQIGRSTSVTPDMTLSAPLSLSLTPTQELLQLKHATIPDDSSEARDDSSLDSVHQICSNANDDLGTSGILSQLSCVPTAIAPSQTCEVDGPISGQSHSVSSVGQQVNQDIISCQATLDESPSCTEQLEPRLPQALASRPHEFPNVENQIRTVPVRKESLQEGVPSWSSEPGHDLASEMRKPPCNQVVNDTLPLQATVSRESSRSIPKASLSRDSSRSRSPQPGDVLVTEQDLPDKLEDHEASSKKVSFQPPRQVVSRSTSSDLDDDSEDDMGPIESGGGLTWQIKRAAVESQKLTNLLRSQERRDSVENPQTRYEKHLAGIQTARKSLAQMPSETKIAIEQIDDMWEDIKRKRIAHDKNVFQNVCRPLPPDGPPPKLQPHQACNQRFKRWWVPCVPEKQAAVDRMQRDRGAYNRPLEIDTLDI